MDSPAAAMGSKAREPRRISWADATQVSKISNFDVVFEVAVAVAIADAVAVAVAVAAPIPAAAAAECAHIDLHLYISRTMCYTGNHVRMYSYMRICVHLRVYPQIHRHIQQMYVVPFCLVC